MSKYSQFSAAGIEQQSSVIRLDVDWWVNWIVLRLSGLKETYTSDEKLSGEVNMLVLLYVQVALPIFP